MTVSRPRSATTAAGHASRARSAVEAAGSADVVWDDGSCAVVEGLTALPGGGLAWDVPDGTSLHRRLSAARREDSDLGVCVGLTDVAPLAGPDRVRGRLALAGWLKVAPGGGAQTGLRVRLDPVEVVWHPGGGEPVAVDEDDYRDATPDPLAAWEADLLLALQQDRDLCTRLERLVAAGPGGRGARSAVPVRLDRAGVVVRLTVPGGHRDVRLRFAHDATTVELAWEGLARLAVHALDG